jgi:hypothetical protein
MPKLCAMRGARHLPIRWRGTLPEIVEETGLHHSAVAKKQKIAVDLLSDEGQQ